MGQTSASNYSTHFWEEKLLAMKVPYAANIYSSEHVEVGGKRQCWSKGETLLNEPLGWSCQWDKSEGSF